MAIALDAGADDIRNDGERWEVLSPPEAHEAVLKALQQIHGILNAEQRVRLAYLIRTGTLTL